jgi:hypothetical protein
VKCADDLVIVAKGETVPQGVIDRLIEAGKFCGLEMNMETIYLFSLLTAVVLTPDGSSTVHIYTQTVHRHPMAVVQYTFTHKQYTDTRWQ